MLLEQERAQVVALRAAQQDAHEENVRLTIENERLTEENVRLTKERGEDNENNNDKRSRISLKKN
jgi:regulator of replication initiation timing